jgi:hypothetical protein
MDEAARAEGIEVAGRVILALSHASDMDGIRPPLDPTRVRAGFPPWLMLALSPDFSGRIHPDRPLYRSVAPPRPSAARSATALW